MDEIDRKQQSEIDAVAAKNAAQDEKDNEHDRKFNRYLFVLSLVLAWMGILTLATCFSLLVENRVHIIVEPRR